MTWSRWVVVAVMLSACGDAGQVEGAQDTEPDPGFVTQDVASPAVVADAPTLDSGADGEGEPAVDGLNLEDAAPVADGSGGPDAVTTEDSAPTLDSGADGEGEPAVDGLTLEDAGTGEDVGAGPAPDGDTAGGPDDGQGGGQDALGQLLCTPGVTVCEGDSLMVCDPTGLAFELSEACATTEVCVVDACVALCDVAASNASSEGCEFLAVTTVNEYLAPSLLEDFAIVVANRTDNPPALVQLSQAGVALATAEVGPGETHTFTLSMVAALVETDESVLVEAAAYEVLSTVPVAAYQHNPLHFEDAAQENYSYSNDASLLLPVHALGTSYMAMSWPTWGMFIAWTSGFVAITAVEDGTEVTFTASSTTLPGATPGLGLEAGESVTVTLDRGDVLQFLGWTENLNFFQLGADTCPEPEFAYDGMLSCQALNMDLTGSRIESTAPLAVFSGHDCLRIPYDTEACDHVEEMLLPTDAWGQEFVLGAPARPDLEATAAAQYRVVALEDGTSVHVFPEVAGPFTLDSGEVATFTTDVDVRIVCDKRVQAMQALLSANGLTPPAILEDDHSLGDPAAGTAVPQRQARAAYVFQVPETYQSNWVNVVRFIDSEVLLDGVPVSSFTQVASTPYEVARINVAPGTHQINSTDGTAFTIMNYGYAPFTSYLYPGGLNIEK